MKRLLYFFTLTVALPAGAQTVHSIDSILTLIAQNNPEIRATAQSANARRWEVKADNNLPDPTVTYSHQWGKPDGQTAVDTELEISQSFDFPTAYIQRSRLNKLNDAASDYDLAAVRRRVLLQAKELCLDIIGLRQEQALLQQRLQSAEQLHNIYNQRLAAGEATIIETRKIRLELLNARTELDMNVRRLKRMLGELQTLNGQTPLNFTADTYPDNHSEADLSQWKTPERVMQDETVQRSRYEADIARQAISVQRTLGLPKLEVGYKRNTDFKTPYNGFIAGVSIPLFSNRHKVRQAEAQAFAAKWQYQQKLNEVETNRQQLYDEAVSLKASLEAYKQEIDDHTTLALLRQALDAGELSMIVYLDEVTFVYQTQQTYLQLQNQYWKVLAQLTQQLL